MRYDKISLFTLNYQIADTFKYGERVAKLIMEV